jgi:hypothetical protein
MEYLMWEEMEAWPDRNQGGRTPSWGKKEYEKLK